MTIYANVAQLKTRLGITNNDNDDLLYSSLEDASREIDRAVTGLEGVEYFTTITLTASAVKAGFGLNDKGIYMSAGRDRIYFPVPIITITAVINDEETLTLSDDYYIGHDFLEGFFTSDRENGVQITGTMGYATVPSSIESLCLTMAEVLSGLATRIIETANGEEIEVRVKSYPAWATKKLKQLRMRIV